MLSPMRYKNEGGRGEGGGEDFSDHGFCLIQKVAEGKLSYELSGRIKRS